VLERTRVAGVMALLIPLLAVRAGTADWTEPGAAPPASESARRAQAAGAASPRRTRAFVLDDAHAATVYVGLIGLRGGEKANIDVFTIEPARHKGEFLVSQPLVTSRDPLRVPAGVPIYIGLKYVQDPPSRSGPPVAVVCGASVTLTATFRYNVLCDVDAHLMVVRFE
jgi:hypothetical protein